MRPVTAFWALVADLTTPAQVTPAPAASSSPNLLVLVLLVLIVVLLVLILVLRLGGRRRAREKETQGAPSAAVEVIDEAAPEQREIYQPRPSPLYTPPAMPDLGAGPEPSGESVVPAESYPSPAEPWSSEPYTPPATAETAYPAAPLTPWSGASGAGAPAETPPETAEAPIAPFLPAPAPEPVTEAEVEGEPAAQAAPEEEVEPAAQAAPEEEVEAPPPEVPIIEPPPTEAPVAPIPFPPEAPEPDAEVTSRAAEPVAEVPDQEMDAAEPPLPPLPAGAQIPAAAVPSAAAETGPNPQLILLIEDDERIAKFYTILFQAKGFAVENARDGVEGVDMATSLKPALILLDVMMPKMNGLMVLQTLRANPETESTPVVVLSNYMEPPLIQRALQLGAIEYVVKSQARPEQLVNALPNWLKGEPALH